MGLRSSLLDQTVAIKKIQTLKFALRMLSILALSACAMDADTFDKTIYPTLSATPLSLSILNSSSHNIFPEGGKAPYSYSITGSGSIIAGRNSIGEYYAEFTAGVADLTDTITIRDAKGTVVTVSVQLHSNPKLYFMSSFLQESLFSVDFNTTTNAFSSSLVLDFPTATALRGFAPRADGSIVFGDFSLLELFVSGADLVAQPSITLVPGLSGVVGVHGLCGLPNGNMIVSSGADATANPIAEFDSSGNFVRAVATSGAPLVPLDHPAVPTCLALSNRIILVMETDTWGVTGGTLTQFNLVNDTWVLAQRLDLATFDSLNGTASTAGWGFTVHTDGNIYLPPINPQAGRTEKLIRCPADNLLASACVTVGDNLPTGNLVYGIVQIPGGNDMLVTTGLNLYRYDYLTGTYTNLGTYSTASGAFLRANSFIRMLFFN